MLILPGVFGIDRHSEALKQLAHNHTVLFATHPGFETSPRPDWLNSVDDLTYLYLDLAAEAGMRDVSLIGVSFGGWVAAEIAVHQPSWLARLILVDAFGLRAGDVDEREFADLFALSIDEIKALAFEDPEVGERYLGTIGRDEAHVLELARGQEALAAYAWRPYLHNPKLRRRLHRVKVPTLVIWGERDRIIPPSTGRALADAIPGAEWAEIPDAGHLPHFDNPQQFGRAVSEFLDKSSARNEGGAP